MPELQQVNYSHLNNICIIWRGYSANLFCYSPSESLLLPWRFSLISYVFFYASVEASANLWPKVSV
ncbi:hypothetical protein S7335_5515 [Synechococcus sp. PCC 7335]|nr:hypothetical protein S7335_5515 [Synechococcus sp. PCC 7335]